MSIPKTSKSVVKYKAMLQLLPKPVKKPWVFSKNIKQPFWKEEKRAALCKEILGVMFFSPRPKRDLACLGLIKSFSYTILNTEDFLLNIF